MVAFLWSTAAAAPPIDRHLADLGLTHEAFVEALRIADGLPIPQRDRAYHDAGQILWRGDEPALAAQHYGLLEGPEARIAQGWSLYRSGVPGGCVSVLSLVPDPRSGYLNGWCLLEMGEARAASDLWAHLPDGPLAPPAHAAAAWIVANGRVPYRSPSLAGVMSAVVPGLGQAYASRWSEAGSAFLVNGSMIAGTAELFRRELIFPGIALSVFAVAFYGGNILSAINGARRFNRRAREGQVDAMRPDFQPIVTVEGGETFVTVP